MMTMTQSSPRVETKPETRWQGDVEYRNVFFPSGKFKQNGEPILRKSQLISIVLTNGLDQLSFNVTHRKNRLPSITDGREATTGTLGTDGLWGTRDLAKRGGPRRSLTPSGWVVAVRNMIPEAKARQLLQDAGV
jgi:hypothetical protein